MAVAVVQSAKISALKQFPIWIDTRARFWAGSSSTPRGSAEIEVVHQTNQNWQRLGSVEDLKRRNLQQLDVGHTLIALSHRSGEFGAVSGRCNHAGGPLGQGSLRDDYIVCPWHNWMFHRLTGESAAWNSGRGAAGTPSAFRMATSMLTSQPLPSGFMHRMPSTR